jgi:hypothetical protein
MARLFFSTTSGSAPCPRCGNLIARVAQTCVHCGADLQADAGPSLASSLRLPFLTRRYGALSAPYPSVAEASELGGRGHRKDVSKAIAIGGVALALIAGGVIYYAQRGDTDTDIDATDTEAVTGQSVYGPIDSKLVRDNTPKAGTSTAAVLPASAPAAATATPMATATTTITPAPVLASRSLPAAPSRDAALASTIDNLQATRDAIERGDLTTARRRFSKIPASQLEAGNVQRTQAELIRLEHARDDSLQFARSCAATESWACARQNARDVLTVDASNVEAQALVEHAIERSGWLKQPHPTTPARGGTPRAAVASPDTVPAQAATSKTVAITRPRPAAIQQQPQVTNGGQSETQAIATPHAATPVPADTAPAVQRAPAPVVLQQIAPVPVQAAQPAHAVTAPAVAPATPIVATPAPAPTTLTHATAAIVNPPAAPTPKRRSFDAVNPDDRERAILENGWSKNPPQAAQSPSQ